MSTIRTNAILDAAGGNTATINGITPVLASQAQAVAGAINTVLMTPLRVAEAIAALGGSGFDLQVFTASGTYTPTAGRNSALIFCTGGGEGGQTSTASNGTKGAGGAAGATAVALADISDGTARAVTIGAGGGASLVDGGTTSVASLCSASGGGATYAVTGALGIRGGPGGVINTLNFGGASFWGGGAAITDNATTTSGTTGATALVYGGGGGGGAAGTGAGANAGTGGTGAAGVVLILEF